MHFESYPGFVYIRYSSFNSVHHDLNGNVDFCLIATGYSMCADRAAGLRLKVAGLDRWTGWEKY